MVNINIFFCGCCSRYYECDQIRKKITKVNFGSITLNEGAIPYNTVDGTVSIASSEDTKAIIEISNLKHVYDGSPKSASISVSVSVDQTIVTYSGKTYNGAIYEVKTFIKLRVKKDRSANKAIGVNEIREYLKKQKDLIHNFCLQQQQKVELHQGIQI